MADDIKIGIAGDASKFIRETGDAEEALEKVSDALDDMARDTKQGADKAERAVDDLSDSFDEARRAVKKLDDATDDVGSNTRRSMRDAGDDVARFGQTSAEVGDELKQNLGETFSSFRGDLEDLPQIAQDTLGGLAGSGALGGIPGLMVTAAGAAGIGLLIGAFEKADEAAKASAERASEWADSFIEAGSRTLTFEQEAAKVRDILTDSEKYKVAAENAKLWGVSVETAVAGMAGSQSALDEVADAIERKREATEKDTRAAQEMAEANGGTLSALTPMEVELNKATDAYNLLTGEIQRGSQAADIMSRYLIDTARATEGATESVDEFGDTIITLPDGKQVYIDAQTGRATDNVNAIQSKIYGVQGKTVGVGVDTSGASAGLSNWISQNNGKTIKIYGKYISPAGSNIP